jgi:hypothetical protein
VNLAILGSGLVSPFGASARDHAIFLRALLPPPPASPFVGPEDKPVHVRFCRWLGAAAAAPERMVNLAVAAAEEALGPPGAPQRSWRVGLCLCTDPARPGLSADDLARVEAELMRLLRPASMGRVWGSAGAFSAIEKAEEQLAAGEEDALLLIAVDSFVSLEWLTYKAQNQPTKWMLWPPTPSEGAAAILLSRPDAAKKERVPLLARVLGSVTAQGSAREDDDEIADGSAMSAAIRKVAAPSVHYVFGQGVVDSLRRREWSFAMARNAERFRAGHDEFCLEDMIGSVGAAAGAMNLVYGLAAMRHEALDVSWSRAEPFLSWAISRDGTVGLASTQLEGE